MVEEESDKKISSRKQPWSIIKKFALIFGILGAVASVATIWISQGGDSSISGTTSSGDSRQMNQTGDNSTQSATEFSDPIETVTVPGGGSIQGASIEPALSTNIDDMSYWELHKNLKFENNILSFKKNRGQPLFFLTLSTFSQENTYSIWFIPRSDTLDLILRVENAFDIRPGDGGLDESALYQFVENGPWTSVPLKNANTQREDRFQFPCPLAIGREAKITMKVDAEGNYRKVVRMYYEYTCENEEKIDTQNEQYEPALWTFTVPERMTRPSRFGVGLNDPDGKDKPSVEIIRVEIQEP